MNAPIYSNENFIRMVVCIPTNSNGNMRGAAMAKANPNGTQILRRKQVERLTGMSRSTIYLWIQQGTFPRPVSLGPRAVGWVEHEIQEWLAERIENRDKELAI